MAVVLARADSRLVHGQILEAWVPALAVDSILVVDRELGLDPLRKMVIEGLGRAGLRVQIADPARAVELLDGPLADARVLLLFAGLAQAADARDSGVPFQVLNLGNLHPKQGSRSLTVSVYLTEEDEGLLRHLLDSGMAIEARAVPADRSPDLGCWLAGGEQC